jgi:hypothetical protein
MTQHAYTILHNVKTKRAIIQETECKIATETEMQEYIKTLRQNNDKATIIQKPF